MRRGEGGTLSAIRRPRLKGLCVRAVFIVGLFFFFSSRRRHTRCSRDWSSDVCSSDLVVQGDAFNASRLATTVVVPLTSNLRWASAPGNLVLVARRMGLPRDSVANVSQIDRKSVV